jgi:flagellar FliL protein
MATEKPAPAEGEEPAEAGKSKGGKKLILILAAAVVLVGGGVAAWLMLGGKHDPKEAKAKVESKEVLPPRYITIDPPFVVNFEAQSAVRFLQVSVGIMTREPELEKLLKDNDPRMRNDLLLILGNQSYETLSSLAGKEELRKRCLEAVRTIVKELSGDPTKVEALYFTSFVMQ